MGETSKDSDALISEAFQIFLKEAPEQAGVWGRMVEGLAKASALEGKTAELAYLAVLSALNRPSGIPFHVETARAAGATREEVISAILVGLPVAGHVVTQCLPPAISALGRE